MYICLHTYMYIYIYIRRDGSLNFYVGGFKKIGPGFFCHSIFWRSRGYMGFEGFGAREASVSELNRSMN